VSKHYRNFHWQTKNRPSAKKLDEAVQVWALAKRGTKVLLPGPVHRQKRDAPGEKETLQPKTPRGKKKRGTDQGGKKKSSG